ncbi:hypothetical protein [Cohnella abietis]|uniref:Uncharacterized protein n=1 Tax=Cohnella abietis TaxID=2507935 RepID=A0A3T1D1E3_9BACL|nr:hypothetical protein [Cohnella abietis]BBI31825.1 hypothetical protein KCTCHS21_12240 [Cohnella abietis]
MYEIIELLGLGEARLEVDVRNNRATGQKEARLKVDVRNNRATGAWRGTLGDRCTK